MLFVGLALFALCALFLVFLCGLKAFLSAFVTIMKKQNGTERFKNCALVG